MWSVFQRLSGAHPTASCWFCHETTTLVPPATTRDWFCARCKNHNTLDAAGNIVDPRADMFSEPATTTQARRSAPGTHDDNTLPQVFCATCQRNQELVCQILAAYLPDEDDPEYTRRVEDADAYAHSLRRRYPLVCRSCQGRVDQRLQMQAQWMYRRELASALSRSEHARTRGASRTLQPQPSLRRKHVVVTWIVCATAALVFCPVAAVLWYYMVVGAMAPRIDVGAAGVAIAVLTFMARLLNPLWLYVAYNPGVRVSGLPLYKRRLSRLAALRMVAAVLQAVHCPLAIWVLVIAYDLALTVLAVRSIRTRTGKRLRLDIPTAVAATADANKPVGSTGTRPPVDLPLTSFESMSFGPSESNRDQDDSFWDAGAVNEPQASWRSHQRRPEDGGSSGDETSTVNTEVISGLDTLTFGSLSPWRSSTARRKDKAEAMDVDVLTSAMMGGNINNKSSSSSRNLADQLVQRRQSSAAVQSNANPRPFEAFRFQRDIPTGLESKLSAFTLDDEDDGSYQGLFGSAAMDLRLLGPSAPHALALSLRLSIALCTVGSWFGDALVVAPLWCAWPVRLALTAALLATACRSAPTGLAMWRRVLAGILLAVLVGVPVFCTFRGVAAEEEPAWAMMALRWPQTRLRISRSLQCALDTQSSHCVGRLPLLVQADWLADAAALLYLILSPPR
ncbi:hypothetical protein EV175_000480 [Coemansia sp. RSA 1933]|nr:hypothetical protein EV175_000480 [Coemansia sp. RSA 1933]